MSFFKHLPLVILALTFAAFGISTGEFVMPGLLEQITHDFNINMDRAGLLISAYALGVVIGGPIMAAVTLKFNRKKVLIFFLSLFGIGNLLCALSFYYPMLLISRMITALCPGAFFGFATVAATELVETPYRTRAVALVFIGTTLANMLGVPLGAALGYFLSWRAIFWIVAAISIFAIIILIKKFPDSQKIEQKYKISSEFIIFKRATVLISFLLSALLNAGFFVIYTYITPMLTQVLNIPAASVSLVLFMLGISLPIGTYVGGKLGDKNQIKALMGLFSTLICLLVLFFLAIPYTPLCLLILFFWNTLVFTTTPILQTMAIENAFEAPHLSSTFNQSAFNVGVVTASACGSFLLHANMPLKLLPIVGICFWFIGLICIFVYKRLKQPI